MRRGKSLTPESRMSLELSSSCSDERSEATDEASESAILKLKNNAMSS